MGRFLGVFAFVLAGMFAGTLQGVAQTDSSTTRSGAAASPLGVRPAPIGHRQPTAESVKRAEAERGQKNDRSRPAPPSVNLDKNLTICRGC